MCYVKLIVSSLDYTLDSVTRKVLENALTSAKTRSGRLYSTQFLIVLLRSRIPNFEVWGIPLIIQQTKDPDRSVVLAAMDVLEEACHEKVCLQEQFGNSITFCNFLRNTVPINSSPLLNYCRN